AVAEPFREPLACRRTVRRCPVRRVTTRFRYPGGSVGRGIGKPALLHYRGAVAVAERTSVRITGLPAGRPVLFAHGFGCDQSLWRLVAPDFEVDHRVVLFDHVGSG